MTRSLTPDVAIRPAAVAPRIACGDVVEVVCTDLIAKTGQAVGRVDGLVVYVLGPVPGERARVRIGDVKANYAVADLIEVLESSPDRAEPFCPVFGTCGGCTVQHLSYSAQLAWKRNIIVNALSRIGGIADSRVGFSIGMRVPRAYRNKMALVVQGGTAQAPTFGFYAARTHDVVAVDACPIVAPQLDRVLAGLWDASRDPAAAAAFEGARHVIARAGRGRGATIAAVTTERPSASLRSHAAALAACLPEVTGISNSFEPPSENAVMGRKHVTVYGNPAVSETIAGITFTVSAASFFQVNSEMVAQIFAFLQPFAGGAARIVDLYCGAGTFALFFATHGAQVVGIEENPHAVREAEANAVHNGVTARTSFLRGRVDAVLRSKAGSAALAAADAVFLDPPRKGSDEATLGALVRGRVRHVWYLSCNPATLARDLAFLMRGGYRLCGVQPFDMFPQTGHIEALALLHRADVAPYDVTFQQKGVPVYDAPLEDRHG